MGFNLFGSFGEPVRNAIVRLTLRPEDQDWSIRLPFKATRLDKTSLKIGIHCHIFHVDLADELLEKVSHCPFPFRLVITSDTEAKRTIISRVLQGFKFSEVEIRIVPNRGRDVAPRLISCRDLFFSCDLLLFLHTKNTACFSQRADWRRWLVENNCGSADMYRNIVGLFENDGSIGLIYPQTFPLVRRWMVWGGLFRSAQAFYKRMNIELSPLHKLDFPVGSMYWARTKAMMPLIELNLRWDDFPEEAGQAHGTLAHVIERSINYVCESVGYRWVKILSADVNPTGRMIRVNSQDELTDFLKENDYRLLKQLI